MANRYWVSGGSSANWNATGNTNWGTASNTQDNAAVPTAADDVFFDGVGTGAADCTISAAAVCRSMNCTGYSNTLTHGAFTLTIGDATAGASNVALKLVSGMTYTLSNASSSAISYQSSSATQQSIDYAGKNAGSITIGATAVSGNYILTGQVGVAGDTGVFAYVKGTLDTNDQTIYINIFASNYTNTRVLDLGTSTIYMAYSGSGANIFFLNSTNLTLTAGSSTLNFANATYGANGIRVTTSVTLGTITAEGAGTLQILADTGATLTIGTLNRVGTAVKTCGLVFGSSQNFVVTGTLNLDGNSGVNRLLIAGGFGTAANLTLTGATISGCSNVDFRDITFVNSPGGTPTAVDFSGITGGSGDCGGNTQTGSAPIFTTADDWYWYAAGNVNPGNFSDYQYWYTATAGGGTQMASTTCPLPQDTCYFDSSSVNGTVRIVQDLPRIPAIDFTGVDAMTFDMNNISSQIYGSLILSENLSLTPGASYSVYFYGRSSYTLISANNDFVTTAIYIDCVGGELSLGDNLLISSDAIVLEYGTLTNTTYTITTLLFLSSNSNLRTWNMGSGTWQLIRAGVGDLLTLDTITNLTLNEDTSTISLEPTTNVVHSFATSGLQFNNLTIKAGSTASVTMEGSNIFNVFTIDSSAAAQSVKFTAGTTTTVSSFVATGTAVNGITITSATAATHTLTDTSGTNAVEYCTISYSIANGGATWNALVGCTDGGNNTGWNFSAGGTTLNLRSLMGVGS